MHGWSKNVILRGRILYLLYGLDSRVDRVILDGDVVRCEIFV